MRRGFGGGSSAPSAESQYSVESQVRATTPSAPCRPVRASPTVMPAQRARSCAVDRPAAGGEALRHRDQRLLPRQLARLRAGSPVVEQHDGLLLALHRPEADEPLLGEPEEDVVPVAAPGLDALALEQIHHLGPAEPPVAAERAAQQLGAALDVGRLEPDLRAAPLVGGEQARAAERQQPAHVLGRREVDRPAHQPGARDLAIGDGALDACSRRVHDPGPDRPQRLVVVLRLHRAQPADDVGGVVEAAGGDPLARDTAMSDAACQPRPQDASGRFAKQGSP